MEKGGQKPTGEWLTVMAPAGAAPSLRPTSAVWVAAKVQGQRQLVGNFGLPLARAEYASEIGVSDPRLSSLPQASAKFGTHSLSFLGLTLQEETWGGVPGICVSLEWF